MKYSFETLVEKMKFDIYTAVAKSAFRGTLDQDINKIPALVSPGPKSQYRCCIYMERAISSQRLAFMKEGIPQGCTDIIHVLPIACDQCPMGGYTVTNSCRGCIGHACVQACPRGAIKIDNYHHAHIDKDKCVNCGMCAKVCPFGAIYNFRRPCQKACRVNAISMDENLAASINHSKCINCGACMTKCPFGAINDRTQMIQVIDTLKNKKQDVSVVAVVAPAIASQVAPNTVEQTVEAMKMLGFDKVVEAALGADVVAWEEADDLVQHGKITSSCCPAFVTYIEKYLPEIKDKISKSLSPMAQICKIIKEKYPNAITIFVGPCTAKKAEAQKPQERQYVDFVLTFQELRAMINAKAIDLDSLKGEELENATGFGRGFARCGGLSDAVIEVLKEKGVNFNLCHKACDGIDECLKALSDFKQPTSKLNFVEGMVCDGGCIGGAGSISHNKIKSKVFVDLHAKKSKKKTVKENFEAHGKKK